MGRSNEPTSSTGSLQAELRDDVAPDARGGGGRERVHAGAGQRLAKRASCRYSGRKSWPHWLMQCASSTAMKLNRRGRQPPDERVAALADEPLGRDVEQRIAALAKAGAHASAFWSARQRAVVAGRRHAVADERVDLVLHQRDERRDDQREAVADERRRLEAQRLAAARRQHEQRVAAGEDGVHRFALQRPERGVAPVAAGERTEGFRQTRGSCKLYLGHGRDASGNNRWPLLRGRQFLHRSLAPVPRAVITHAHGDHARMAARRTSARPTPRRFCAALWPDAVIETLPYGEPSRLGEVRVSFHPAGHILGSAQIRIEGRDGVWVSAGDYKRAQRSDVRAVRARRVRHLHHREHLRAADLSLGSDARRDRRDPGVVARERARGRTSVLFCYTIGKAQRVLAELARVTRPAGIRARHDDAA